MADIFRGVKGAGVMDYVTAWYIKSGKLIKINPKIETAFVSTNSISQGEQVGILWGEMFGRFGAEIKFAHQSFSWTSEAKDKAQITVIIIGFRKNSQNFPEEWQLQTDGAVDGGKTKNSPFPKEVAGESQVGYFSKTLYTYPDLKGDPIAKIVKNINPYLVEGENVVITKRSKPICNVKSLIKGNLALDYSYLIFKDDEKNEFVKKEPLSEKFFKRFLGGNSIINNEIRWCLWFKDANPIELRKMPEVLKLLEKVKEARL